MLLEADKIYQGTGPGVARYATVLQSSQQKIGWYTECMHTVVVDFTKQPCSRHCACVYMYYSVVTCEPGSIYSRLLFYYYQFLKEGSHIRLKACTRCFPAYSYTYAHTTDYKIFIYIHTYTCIQNNSLQNTRTHRINKKV